MFIAQESESFPFLKAALGEGVTAYKSITLTGQLNFFLVEFRCEEDGFDRATVLVNSPSAVEALQKNPAVVIQSIYVVSPGRINKSGQWKIDLLQEVWHVRANDGDMGIDATEFVLANGSSYFDGAPLPKGGSRTRLL